MSQKSHTCYLLLLLILILEDFNVILCFEEDLVHSWYQNEDYRSFEEIRVKKVITNDTLKISHENVSKWRSVQIGSTNYAIGVGNYSLVLSKIWMEPNIKIESKVIGLSFAPKDVTLISSWNSSTQETDIIAAVGINGILPEIKWYQIKNTTLSEIWSWPLEKNITHINIFEMDGKNNIAIGKLHENKSTLDIYEFEINKKLKNFWLRQSLELPEPSTVSNLISLGQYYYLSTPQHNHLYIYKYNNAHFEEFTKIPSEDISTVVSFKSKFRSFIAIDGTNAGIYQIKEDYIVEVNVVNTDLEGIASWFLLPIKTYRNDVLLLAQRKVQHDSHHTNITEIISNNGNFVKQEDIPCDFFKDQNLVVNCLTVSGFSGFSNAANIYLDGDVQGILIPYQDFSLIFLIEAELERVESPMSSRKRKLEELKQRLQNLLKDETQYYENLIKTVEYPNKDRIKQMDIVKNNTSKQANRKNSTAHAGSQRNADEKGFDVKAFEAKVEMLEKEISKMDKKITEILTQENKTNFETVIVKTPLVEIKGSLKANSVQVDGIGEAKPEFIFNDLVTRDSNRKIEGLKTFTNLLVQDLNFKELNGINAEEIIFKNTNSSSQINGNITFKDNLLIRKDMEISSGKINDFDLEDMVYITKTVNVSEPLNFEHVKATEGVNIQIINGINIIPEKLFDNLPDDVEKDDFYIPGNMTVKTINGEDFTEFIRKICMTNVITYIPKSTKIDGRIEVSNSSSTKVLNGVNYPSRYVFNEGVLTQNVTVSGVKSFLGNTTIEELSSEGLIDGVDSKSGIVTLSDTQSISGKVTFENLEITENFNVTGDIICAGMSSCIDNPLLTETNVTNAPVYFKSLEVEGNVKVLNNFNEINAETRLQDIIYKDEETATITGVKQFVEGLTIKGPLEVTTASINNVPINSIVTKDTDQVLKIGSLEGVVDFENVNLRGLYGGHNITKLNQETMKTTGEQYISATLIFDDDLDVNELKINKGINGRSSDEYLFANETIDLSSISFENLQSDNLFIGGDFNGNITDFDILSFNQNRMSYGKSQEILGIVTDNCTINNVKMDKINNVSFHEIILDDASLKSIIEDIKKGKIKIENLFVTGDLDVQWIDGNDARKIILDTRKYVENIPEELFITGNATFENIEIKKLSDADFHKFSESLVYKNDTNIKLRGNKSFNGLYVRDVIGTKKLNHVPLEDFLRKQTEQDVDGPLIIKGDVVFESNVTVGEINGIPFENILDSFGVKNEVYHVKHDMIYLTTPNITNLHVNGAINGEIMDEILNDVVNKDEKITMKNKITFKDNVIIRSNLEIKENVNKINLSKKLSQIVYNDRDAIISGPIIFTDPVYVFKNISVNSDVESKNIFGCDLEEWKKSAVFTNRGMLHGNYTFNNVEVHEGITTDFIKDLNMSSIIPLKSDQYITRLNVENLIAFRNISVGNLVNGLNLKQEVENTIMANKDQEISMKTIFNRNVLINNDLEIDNLVNKINLSSVVTTNTDQNLTADYLFNGKTHCASNITVHGLVNGINMTDWASKMVKVFSQEVQTINDDWDVEGNITFDDYCTGNGSINDFRLSEIAEHVENRREHTVEMETALMDNHVKICKDLKNIHNVIDNQMYKFKYFENDKILIFQNPLEQVYPFKHEDKGYILIKEEDECESHLVTYNGTLGLVSSFNFGSISNVISTSDTHGNLFIITTTTTTTSNNTGRCNVTNTNVWKLVGDSQNITFEHLKNLQKQELLQSSIIPGTFYGANKRGITEFRIISLNESFVKEYRHWDYYDENMDFVPRGLQTGLAMRTGKKLVKLSRKEPGEDFFDFRVNAVIEGTWKEELNHILPGKNEQREILVIKVGYGENSRNLFAIASHEETDVRGRLDFIKIYEDINTGQLFHKIPTYKPTSLISLNFNNGETLLIFLEDLSTLQVYEYKGIEGFKHRISAKLKGTRIIQMPSGGSDTETISLGLVSGKEINVLKTVMISNQTKEKFECELKMM